LEELDLWSVKNMEELQKWMILESLMAFFCLTAT
jgi:hypothetical protein